MTRLDTRYEYVEEVVFKSIGHLASLEHLSVGPVDISGTVLSCLSKVSKLTHLTLYGYGLLGYGDSPSPDLKEKKALLKYLSSLQQLQDLDLHVYGSKLAEQDVAVLRSSLTALRKAVFM